MSSTDNIRLTAKGLVRNFGRNAEREAARIARRCARRNNETAQLLWAEIVRELQKSAGGALFEPALRPPCDEQGAVR